MVGDEVRFAVAFALPAVAAPGSAFWPANSPYPANLNTSGETSNCRLIDCLIAGSVR